MSDVSTLFELLAADRRRQILVMLCNADEIRIPEGLQTRGPTQVRSRGTQHLQRQIREKQSSQSLEVTLCHTHLPKLEDAGLVEWDEDAETVSRGPKFEEIEPALRLLIENVHKLPSNLF